MKVLQNKAQVIGARKIMVQEGLSAIEPRWRSALRRAGWNSGLAVGDFIKSWDVLETIRFLERLDKSAEILDIGAYASEVIVALHRKGYQKLTGADLDPRLSTMPYADAIDYRICNFMQTPFADASFQAVTAISVIEHGFDAPRLLAEVSRLLRPGGYFVSSFDYWQDKIETTGHKFFGMSWCIFSEAEIRQFIEQAAGFGLFPVDAPSYVGADRFVRSGGKRYTFGWLALQKH